MGETTTRGRANQKKINPEVAATLQLAEDLFASRRGVLEVLAIASAAARNPEEKRAAARATGDQVVDEALQRAEAIVAAARTEAERLLQEAEAEIRTSVETWRAAYDAALDEGWDPKALAKVKQPRPPRSAPRGGKKPLRTNKTTERELAVAAQDDRGQEVAVSPTALIDPAESSPIPEGVGGPAATA